MNRLNTLLTILGGGALAGGGYLAYTKWQNAKADNKPERELDDTKLQAPDEPVTPNSTGYKRVDAILPKLRQVAHDTGIPLGLLIGWIAKESGGKLAETTKYDERGYFQLMPDESKALGLDHLRLSTDSNYSIDPGGVKLIQRYMKQANLLNTAPTGTSYYWRLVKLLHTMGSGATKKIVEGAKQVAQAGSWEALRQHAMDNDSTYLHTTKHSPKKWFPLVDAVYTLGKPFGFGLETTFVSGRDVVIGYAESLKEPAFPAYSEADVDALARALESSLPKGSIQEKQAVAWVIRNRAQKQETSIYNLLCPQGPGPRGSNGRSFCSTRLPATAPSLAIAKAVLSLPQDADPTHDAVDYWLPEEQKMATAQYGLSYEAAREALTQSGLRPSGLIGRVELLVHG